VVTEVDRYARWFDMESPGWTKDEVYNRSFILHQERYFNDYLRVKGYLYLNDVYVSLGLPRTRAGQLIGWIYEEGKTVKIDILECKDDGSLLLDFNVDGIIIDKM
jgi:hypothetical protein